VNAADRLIPKILAIQLFTGISVFVVFLASGQGLLLLDPQQARGASLTTFVVGALTETVTLVTLLVRLRRVRFVLRALALGSRAFEPDQLVELGEVPSFVTRVSVLSGAGFSSLTMLPFLRDSSLDLATSVSLFLLAILLIAAAAVPLFALTRSAVSRVLELVPPDEGGEAIAILDKDGTPARRVRAHMLAAVLTPTFFVAMGATLVAFAHVRSESNLARLDASVGVVRACLDTFDGALPEGGQDEAIDLAESIGHLHVRMLSGPSAYTVERISNGRMFLTIPLTLGHAEVTLDGVDGGSLQVEAILALMFVLVIATWLGSSIGGLLSDDLVLATKQIAQLGNEEVLRGEARIARPARLKNVAELGRSIETLADRFREFAGAQERAIEAREAALRLRGLLFASVSHDLKSPLNAVLGFCALLDTEPLVDGQRESVVIIERRARELLALIETILDAARIEARQLALHRSMTTVDEVVEEAVRRGDDLGPIDAANVAVRVLPGLPMVKWDGARIAQGIAALVGHAKRLSPGGGVELSARRGSAGIEVLVYEPSGAIPPGELVALLDARNAATAPRRLGGLALGLSLARSLIELHGGSLEVAFAASGPGSVFVVRLPT
jgi:signal transduction histidine kinase